MESPCLVSEQTLDLCGGHRDVGDALWTHSKLTAPDELHSGKLQLHKILFHDKRWVRGSTVVVVQQEIVCPVCAAVGTVAVDSPCRSARPSSMVESSLRTETVFGKVVVEASATKGLGSGYVCGVYCARARAQDRDSASSTTAAFHVSVAPLTSVGCDDAAS